MFVLLVQNEVDQDLATMELAFVGSQVQWSESAAVQDLGQIKVIFVLFEVSGKTIGVIHGDHRKDFVMGSCIMVAFVRVVSVSIAAPSVRKLIHQGHHSVSALQSWRLLT